MDVKRTIRELRERHARLVAAIDLLEELAGSTNGARAPRSGRGRKFMGGAERRDVSERMKRYWAKQRKARGAM